jgi:succinyl-diaminopimelate desuccinylase
MATETIDARQTGPRDTAEQSVLERVDSMAGEAVAFLQELLAIPTVNPPGENYQPCAELIGARLTDFGYDIQYVPAEGMPEHTTQRPRVNVIGALRDSPARPCLHFNGHFDVVPVGDGWTVDPFAGLIRDGQIFGRGSTDQKAGIAASIYAVEPSAAPVLDWPGAWSKAAPSTRKAAASPVWRISRSTGT